MNGGKLVIDIETDTKSFDAQIEATRRKLEMLEKSADESTIPEQFRRSKQEAQELNVEIEKTRNDLIKLYQQQEKVNQEAIQTGESSSKGFEKGLNGLKKFALGLVGIRGIYSLVRRAGSAWLSQDTELAKKFQGIWTALGAALAPILEKLAELLMKLIGYVNVFVKAFTGGKVDLIANANAKAIQKQANAMKELKNQTYGFDELNIQQTNEGSGSSSTGLEGFKDIELNPKVKKFVEDLGKVLGKVWGYLEDIIDWCKKHLGTAGTIALGIAAIIGISAVTGGTGLLGILAIVLAIYDVVKGFQLFKDFLDLKEGVDEVNDSMKTTDKSAKNMKNSILDAFDNAEPSKKTKGIDNLLVSLRTSINDTAKSTEDWEKKTDFSIDGILNSFNGVGDTYKKQRDIMVENTDQIIDALIELAKNGEMTEDQYELFTQLTGQYFDDMNTHNNKTMGLLKDDVDKTKKKINELDGLNPTFKVTEKIEVVDKATSVIDNILKKVEKVFGKTGSEFVKLAIQKVDIEKVLQQYKKEFAAFGISYGATGGVLHKSALGSIINNPGRGVYVGGNTIAGEAGKEGIIPLTDPNAMAELGETIGRYITVNLTNITKLDSKVINKENKKINNEMDFATNGGGI